MQSGRPSNLGPSPAPDPSGSERPFVSVIVPVYNDWESLRILLRALANQDYPRQRFECLVVDNASDEPIHVVEDFTLDLRVVREERPGSYVARNRGLREARGAVLAFTDADCIPRPDWLSSAVLAIRAAGKAVVLGGKVEIFSRVGTVPSASEWCSVLNDLDQAIYVSKFHFAATANMITTPEVFDRVGQFNPHFFSGGDYEWGQRAWALGIGQVYAEDTVVRHPAREAWPSVMSRMRRITGGHYMLNGRTGRPALTTTAMIFRMTRAAMRRAWRDPRLPTAGCRLRVMAVTFALGFIQLGEVIRLSFGGQPRRH